MTSVLETLSLKELYTRKKNLIYQLEKIDKEIKNRVLENEVQIEICSDLDNCINENTPKIIIKKSGENLEEESNETVHIIRKIKIKIKK
jgi:hypothetical protein